jgi:hypothetical protein
LNWIETDEPEKNLILPLPAGASGTPEGSGQLRLSPFLSRLLYPTTQETGYLLRMIQGGLLILTHPYGL